MLDQRAALFEDVQNDLGEELGVHAWVPKLVRNGIQESVLRLMVQLVKQGHHKLAFLHIVLIVDKVITKIQNNRLNQWLD